MAFIAHPVNVIPYLQKRYNETDIMARQRRFRSLIPVGREDSASFFLSAITILELERGILEVQRRDVRQGARLRTWLDNHVRPEFAGRILPIDDAVATRCAHLHMPDRRNEVDALIATTALIHGLTVVTCNAKDFQGTGVIVADPWLR